MRVTAVRPLRKSDLAEVLAIEAASNPHPWHEGDFRPFVDAAGDGTDTPLAERPPFRGGAVKRAWVCQGPGGPVGADVLGFACAAAVADEAELQSIAVRPAVRRGGVGSALLETVLEWARDAGYRALHLEVRAGNVPAIGLYRRFGFVQTGLRRGYYQDDGEDALLLTRDFANFNRSST